MMGRFFHSLGRRTAAVAGLTVTCVLTVALLAAPAFAAAPPTSPQLVQAVDFDSGAAPFVLAEDTTLRPALAGWGTTSATRRGSSGAGLWCAATAFKPTQGVSSFFPVYPAYGQLVQASAEPLVLRNTNPVRLAYQGNGKVSSIVVRSEPGGGTRFVAGTHYTVGLDSAGYTTIARKSTAIPNGGTVYVDYKWPSSGTRALATLSTPRTEDYYRTWLSLYYLMPSLGAADANSFSVNWSTAANPVDRDVRYGFPKTGAWRALRWEMSAGEQAPVSRTAADIRIRFIDFVEGPVGTQSGQGASVDDVAITGYKYGPVRDVSVTGAGSGSRLQWGKPKHSVTSDTADSRSMSYRVWRRVDGQSAWTELTTDRLTAAAFTDTTRQSGVSYVYGIQAWDPSDGSGYGQLTQVRVSASNQVTRVGSLSITAPATPRYGAAVDVGGVFSDESGLPIPGKSVVVQRSLDGRTWVSVATAVTSPSGAYSITTRMDRSTLYRARVIDQEFGTTYSANRQVMPQVSLTTPRVPTTSMRFGTTYRVTGFLKPRHAAGSRAVQLQAYHLERGRWVLRKTYNASVTNYSTYSAYGVSVKLPYGGSWRLRAYHPKDALHASTVTAFRSVYVR